MSNLRDLCRRLRPDMDEALATIADKFGGDFQTTNMTYSDTGITIKVEFALRGEDGEKVDPRIAKFRAAWRDWPIGDGVYTLPADTLDKVFTHRGTEYKVAGFNSRARKMPIVCIRVSDGREYKFPIDGVAISLGIERDERPVVKGGGLVQTDPPANVRDLAILKD